MLMNRYVVFSLAIFLVSCQSKTTQEASSTAQSSESAVNAYTPNEQEAARIRNNVAKGLLGDSTSFPFVYQGEGRSLIYQAYSMSFTLSSQPALIAMMNSLVPWVKPEANNVNNGIYATYVRNGRDMALNEPYIQVQYINKDLPYCSTLDSIFLWMDNTFLANKDATVLQKRTSLQTASGLPAFVKAYSTGVNKDNPAIPSKWVTNGYIDYDEQYYVAFGLSTTSKDDYDLTRPLFDDLVKSFQQY